MSIHPPKQISSSEGLGVNTTKTMEEIDENISISTELWNEMSEPWREGETIIAEPGYVWKTKWEVGKPYIITKFLNTAGELVGVYCDVARFIQKVADGYEFTDLYLDVWQASGEDPIILDEHELMLAAREGLVETKEAESARQVAENIVSLLKNNPESLDF